MGIAIVTGACGLIGSESVRFFHQKGMKIVGIDNDMRAYFFGKEASTLWQEEQLKKECKNFEIEHLDIRDVQALTNVFKKYGTNIELIVHTAAQPSHDWAAKEPFTDFHVNATGTLNMLEMCRLHCPKAVFLFTSTNKVYGDNPNLLPLIEREDRYEIDPSHAYHPGIDEFMSLDHCKHSLFGASKVAADVLVQEYGRYFGMNTGVFRGGCLTGPSHSGAELHGFLSYLMKCAVTHTPYKIFGYKGKQVRDNIHSNDLVNAFWHFYKNPRQGEAYNMGGGRFSNCSMKEAITLCEDISGNKMQTTYLEDNRIGDHIWYISNLAKFCSHYPKWQLTKNVEQILHEIHDCNVTKWKVSKKVA
ncbi:MAG: NAD-dependent epimerase [Bdellovibrionales bacterium GWA2_49_15]|nr:MAG: NAD-dependent epimerase [Bdellovibrionales bacterium GWA2_49_15]HAZ14442.1 NAD-dependent epimerase [Bdellovibrionales bacterium]